MIVSFYLTSNDSDADNDYLRIVDCDGGTHGSVSVSYGYCAYLPDPRAPAGWRC